MLQFKNLTKLLIFIYVLRINGITVILNATPGNLLSPDILHWEKQEFPDDLNQISNIFYFEDRYIAIGGIGASSADGINWTSLEKYPPFYAEDVAYGNGRIISVGWGDVMGEGIIGRAAISLDGKDWSFSEQLFRKTLLKGIVYANDKFVAVGAGENTMYTSVDGVEWTINNIDTRGSSLEDIIYQGNIFYAVGGNSDVFTSKDTIKWDHHETVKNSSIDEIFYAGGRFVAVGYSGNIITSTNGTDWEKRSSGTTAHLNDVHYAYGKYFVVGSHGTILVSDDCETWNTMQSGTNEELYDMLWKDDKFIIVGKRGTVLLFEVDTPEFINHPQSARIDINTSNELQVTTINPFKTSNQWYMGNTGDTSNPIENANASVLNTGFLEETTHFWVQATGVSGSTNSHTAIMSTRQELSHTPDEVVFDGLGDVVGSNIVHESGNIYDQVLLTGPSVTVVADEGQITRTSFIDVNDDIVQVEYSGSGSMTILVDADTYEDPNTPVNYNQSVEYVKGKARIIIDGADESSNIGIFTVGSATALNPNLFSDNIEYDGIADIIHIKINGTAVGGLFFGNVKFSGVNSKTGISASNIAVMNRSIIGDIEAHEKAIPILLFSENSAFTQDNGTIVVAGGDLLQPNGNAIIVAGTSQNAPFTAIRSQDNIKSDGTYLQKSPIQADFINAFGGAIDVPIE